MDLSPSWILGVSVYEAGFSEEGGAVEMANNYFGVHGVPPKGAVIPPGKVAYNLYHATEDGYLVVYPSYLAGGQAWANKYRSLVGGATNVSAFAETLHAHGMGVGEPRYVHSLESLIWDMAIRMGCVP